MKRDKIKLPAGYEHNGDYFFDKTTNLLRVLLRKKTPILKTHDGVELFVGDPFWMVSEVVGVKHLDHWHLNGKMKSKFEVCLDFEQNPDSFYFSTKKAAKAFINEKKEVELPVSVDELKTEGYYYVQPDYDIDRFNSIPKDRGSFHTKKRAEQMAALDRIVKLYDEWCLLLNYTPDWDDHNERKYVINRNLHVANSYNLKYIIAFSDNKTTIKFLETFKEDLELIQDFL